MSWLTAATGVWFAPVEWRACVEMSEVGKDEQAPLRYVGRGLGLGEVDSLTSFDPSLMMLCGYSTRRGNIEVLSAYSPFGLALIPCVLLPAGRTMVSFGFPSSLLPFLPSFPSKFPLLFFGFS